MPKIKLESKYQKEFLDKVRRLFPGCIILKNDSGYQQGIPDWLILYGPHWAFLEIKPKTPTGPEDFEPNQLYFVERADDMSFGAVVYPENEKEVLHALQFAFRPGREARVSQRQ